MKKERLQEKIQAILDQKDGPCEARFSVLDDSVQKELRLHVDYVVRYRVDNIKYPKNLSKENHPCWEKMNKIACSIAKRADLASAYKGFYLSASSKTRKGQAEREEAKEAFFIEHAEAFLEAWRKAHLKTSLKRIKSEISALQAEQKKLLPELRKANSEYLAKKKEEKVLLEMADKTALESGEFWRASREAIKSYFSPPFKKNYLSDVSPQWRAALFLECKSTAWKAGPRDWRHTLAGTNRGYLCGIDDNGDEWGYIIRLQLDYDMYGNLSLEGCVEDVMCELFNISWQKLSSCQRQGDLLFCPEDIPDNIKLSDCGEWEIRESHTVKSMGLRRNGRYFSSEKPISVTHTSHRELILNPGTYRVYFSEKIID